MYGLAPLDRVSEAAGRMIDAIAVRHGPGRLLPLLDIVHVIADDGMMRVADVGGVPHVFLRSAYFFEPRPTSASAAAPIFAGDQVEWFPDAGPHGLGRRLVGGRVEHVDSYGVRIMRVDATVGWGESLADRWCMATPPPHGSLVDPQVSPGIIRHMSRAPKVTPAGRMEAVLELAQDGRITAEQGRALLEQPDIEARLLKVDPIKVGDFVRWWPDPAQADRYSDCEVIELRQATVSRVRIASHTGPKWSSRDGLIGCERDVLCLGRIERVDPPEAHDPLRAGRLAGIDKALARRGLTRDPLDELYDGVPLRGLLQTDNDRSMERSKTPIKRTPLQLAAISAHWSAQLHAKVAASKAADIERERSRVQMPLDAEDIEW